MTLVYNLKVYFVFHFSTIFNRKSFQQSFGLFGAALILSAVLLVFLLLCAALIWGRRSIGVATFMYSRSQSPRPPGR